METREIDALIAEKFFGWVWVRHSIKIRVLPKTSGEWRTEWRRSLFIPDHKVTAFDGPEGIQYVPANGDEEICVMNAPSYSTEIGTAWEVVEKMRETHKAAFVLGVNGHSQQFSAWFNDGVWALGRYQNSCPEMGDPKCLGSATASTAPRAIVLAALQAIGVEVK